jgi:hypothetical protein
MVNSSFIIVPYWTEIPRQWTYHYERGADFDLAASARNRCKLFDQDSHRGGFAMLWTIFVILLILWLLGFIGGIGGNMVHLLIVVAVIVLAYNLLTGRRSVA